jgi:hypothetical protein
VIHFILVYLVNTKLIKIGFLVPQLRVCRILFKRNLLTYLLKTKSLN